MDHHHLSLFLKKVIGPNVAVIEAGFDSSSQNMLKGPTAGHHLLGKDYIARSTLMHYSVQLYCMCLTPKWMWTKIYTTQLTSVASHCEICPMAEPRK
jgi:hypothetical protein